METTRTLTLKIVAVAAGALAVDQVLKLLVRSAFDLCAGPPASQCDQLRLFGPFQVIRLENAGSALGFAQGLWVWVLVAGLGLLLLPLYGRRLKQAGWLAPLALGLQAGGALGNLVDRALFGGVTDFIALGQALVVNPADLALLLGMALAVQALLRAPRRPAVPATHDRSGRVRLA